MIFDEGPQNADFIMLVPLKVKSVFFAEPHLQQIVVQRLLTHTNLRGCILKGVTDQVAISKDSVVEFAPQTDLFDDVLNRTLFCTFALTRL